MSTQAIIKFLIEGKYRDREGVLAVMVFEQESWFDPEYKGRFAANREEVLVEEPVEKRKWISLGGTNMKEAYQVVSRALDSGFECNLSSCTSDEQLVEYSI